MALVVGGMLAAAGCFQQVDRAPDSPQPPAVITVRPAVSPGPTAAPKSGPVSPATATAGARPTPGRTPIATTVSTPQLPATATHAPVQRYGLFLEIEGLSEESVVRGETVVARGRTRADAVVSINGVVVPVDLNGSFEVLLTLDPGPNIIEVVASDLEGNEETKVIAVVSLPESGR